MMVTVAVVVACCIVSVAAITGVQSPPHFVKQPPNTELLFQVAERVDEDNKPFIIECEADGEPRPTYKWKKNGLDFDWQVYDDRMSQQPGRGTLVITTPRDEDLGYYQCFAENEFGIAMSNAVHVRKSELNSFKDELPEHKVVNEGEPLKLMCKPPDGYPKPMVYWMIQSNSGAALRSINNTRMTVDPEGTLWFSNVTRQDASRDDKYACSATSMFRNEYKLGNKVALSVTQTSSKGGVNSKQPTRQYVSRKVFVAQRGQKAELWCIYGGTPVPEIRWTREGKPILWGRYTISNYGKTLVVKSIDFSDAGSYECTASNGVGSAQSSSFDVKVEAKPYFTITPEIVRAAEGEVAEFSCGAHGNPSPIIQWYHNGIPIESAPSNPRRGLSQNVITITDLEKSDTGNYACNASNSLGYVFKDVYLNVLAMKPEIVTPPDDTSTVDQKSVNLTCEVFGAPKPEIVWMRGGQEFSGGRYKIHDDGTLTIQKVMFSDKGQYTCLAKNKFGEDSKSATLIVKEQTRITEKPRNYEVAAGSTANFLCNAVADSTLNLKILWLHNGAMIDFYTEPRFVQSSDMALTITKTNELDSGTYTCVAQTELDSVRASANLIVQDVPNPPELKGVRCNEKMANVNWEPKGDNRAPITVFIIQHNTSFTPDTWEDSAGRVPTGSTDYDVNMSAWANYTFRVIAVNSIGPSLPSQHGPIPPCSTPGQVPESNPDNVQGKGSHPTNMVISWTTMPQIEHNGPDFQYRVQYMRDLPEHKWTTVYIKDWRTNRHPVENTPTYKKYFIRVTAFNKFGQSSVGAREVIGYSGEDVPLEAPKGFRLAKVLSEKAAIFEWDPIDPETVQGEFKGYKIETWTDREGDKKARETILPNNTNEAFVRNLIPFSTNKAKIRVYNGAYSGPASDTLTFDTPEGTPGPVDSLDAVRMGSSALYLSWSEPREPNGILTGYNIYYQRVEGTRVEPANPRTLQITDPRVNTAKLAGLEANSRYRLSIKATTSVGEGPIFFIERSTASEPFKPTKPRFKWENMPGEKGLAAVRVRWMPPEHNPGSHFYVEYKLRDQTSYTKMDAELFKSSSVVKGLDPGTLYDFRVVAVDGDYETPSDPEEIHTWTPPDAIRVLPGSGVANAGWFIGMMVAIALLICLLALVCCVRRNRGGKYPVHEREAQHGRLDPDHRGFIEYDPSVYTGPPPVNPNDEESDTDSMAEYEGDQGAEGMKEDGSFIGQYSGRRRSGEQNPSSAFATLV